MAGMDIAPISKLAAAQHGVVSSAQLKQLGFTEIEVRTLLRRGWLERVAPRVLGVAGTPASVDRSLMAGLLSLGPAAVVSHEAAARLHEFDRCVPDAIEFCMPRRSRGVRTAFTVHTSAAFGPLARITINGLRGELRKPGRWGAPRLDDLLLDSGGHTILERRFLQLMRKAGLPKPRTQVGHQRDGQTFARVDFLFEEHGVVVEVSGRRGHASDAERARDAQRRNELQDIGQKVYEYTFRQVTRDSSYVIRTMRARLT